MTFNGTGTTALITGASSGIGAEFCRALAARGADLVLVARRQDRLDALAAELGTGYGTTCSVIALDLAAPDAAARLHAQVESSGIRISTLVNNAGFGTHGSFAEIEPERIAAEIQLNVTALVEITRAFLPEMLADGRGALVNVASTAAFQPIPRMAVYAATKAFVLSFTESLAWESRGSGLKVLALNPGPTDTEFHDVAGSGDALFGRSQSVEDVVATAMRALDRRNSPASIISGRQNFAQTLGLRLAPRAFVLQVVGRGGEPKRR